MDIRESAYGAMKAIRPLVEAGRPSTVLREDERAALRELLQDKKFCDLVSRGADRHLVREWIVEYTTTPAGIAGSVSTKISRLQETTGRTAKDLVEDLAASLADQHSGQDIAGMSPELAGMQPDVGTNADAGSTQKDDRGDKEELAPAGIEGEPLGAHAAAEKKVAEGMNDSPDDKFAALEQGVKADGAMGGMKSPVEPGTHGDGSPQGEADRDDEQDQNEDHAKVDDEVNDKESAKADSEQCLDDVKPLGMGVELDQAPPSPGPEAAESTEGNGLESIAESGLTISERLALALTEDAAKKFDIQEGTADWVRLFKSALKKVRSFAD